MMEDGKALLEQLEQILECDRLIDEIGFVHPTQLAALNQETVDNLPYSSSTNLQSEQDKDVPSGQYNEKAFWHGDHKLAISTLVLLLLYNAALQAYRDANRKYKAFINSHMCTDSSTGSCTSTSDLTMEDLGNDILRHSRALLILSCDFGSAWNSRKLVVSRSYDHLQFLNELQLSELVLSHSPKSDYAWTHRRWVIKMISGNCRNLEEIIRRESELVKKIAERTKMNYRAWNHRGSLVPYMSRSQVLEELNLSKSWAKLHVADNSCFHYRRRLMLRLHSENFTMGDFHLSWKEDLDWNRSLIEQYPGREALWIHRRFLLQWGLGKFSVDHQTLFHAHHLAVDLSALLDQELQLLQKCFDNSDDQFDDTHVQAENAASYLTWMWKTISHLEDDTLLQKLKGIPYIQSILNRFCPEKAYLSHLLNAQHI